jgi:glutamate-1-semialdehyde 2,1-aminomutase
MNYSGKAHTKRTNAEIYEQACKIIPGGVSRNTIFHKPHPYYAKSAKGCIVTDIDGTERIDFANNMAALIHGHAFDPIVKAVTEQIAKGTAITMGTEVEVEYACILTQRIPSLEKMRFVNSGTEAVMAMIKASRAFTGRSKIAKAEGAYHGTYDFAEVSQITNPDNWGDIDEPNSVPLANGTPQGVLDNVIVFHYNDIERTINILNKYKDEIACVILDPIAHRVGLVEADENFVEAVYKWTRENGALLVFDEVVTFRTHYGGAQQKYKIKPDLTALGKIIGGGFAIGAFGGRADVMKVLDPSEAKMLFPHSGTFSANPVSMTAGTVAMEYFDQQAVNDINKLTQIAKDQINEAIQLSQTPVCISGAGSMFRMHLKPEKPRNQRESYQDKATKKLIVKMLDYLFFQERLMMVNTMTCMFSTVMTQKEVDILSEAMYNMLRKFRSQIEEIQK